VKYGLFHLTYGRIQWRAAAHGLMVFRFPKINNLQIKLFFSIFDVAQACVPKCPYNRVNCLNTHAYTRTYSI
jgi:hypothetical protein